MSVSSAARCGLLSLRWLLFSPQFVPMRDLFAWQLMGDVMKVGAYVFGYLVIAKAALRFYLLAELSQFLLLSGFSQWLIPRHGALGARQAYMLTYVVYFFCAVVFFLFTVGDHDDTDSRAGIGYPAS